MVVFLTSLQLQFVQSVAVVGRLHLKVIHGDSAVGRVQIASADIGIELHGESCCRKIVGQFQSMWIEIRKVAGEVQLEISSDITEITIDLHFPIGIVDIEFTLKALLMVALLNDTVDVDIMIGVVIIVYMVNRSLCINLEVFPFCIAFGIEFGSYDAQLLIVYNLS